MLSNCYYCSTLWVHEWKMFCQWKEDGFIRHGALVFWWNNLIRLWLSVHENRTIYNSIRRTPVKIRALNVIHYIIRLESFCQKSFWKLFEICLSIVVLLHFVYLDFVGPRIVLRRKITYNLLLYYVPMSS